MTINIRATEASTTAEPLDILALYRIMATARVTNDIMKIRKTQGRFPFYIGCAGHESMAAVAAALNQDDWMALYYRDLAAWLQRTGDIYGPFREAYSRTTGPMCAGRNMPSHYSSKRHRILPTFSEVGALAPFAGGVGFSLQWHKSKDIIMFTSGDGGAATNDFNALFRQASVHQLPVLMVIEDNGWAITAPSSIPWGGSLVEWAKGGGVYAEEIELTMATKDPVKNFGRWLVENEHIQEGDIERIRKEVRADLENAEAQVLQESEPAAERVLEHVVYVPKWQENIPRGAKKQLPMLGAINEALIELAQRDPDFFVYGQDVGSPRGGVFGATAMLVKQFPGRAINSPLNEQVIVGIAAGAGMIDGKARCAEIQFVDYHQSAAQTIRMAARVSYQSLGDWTVPLLIRTKSGSGGGGPISSGGAGGGAFGHSNAGEQWFTSIPGMITICPATPFDAKGLLLEAARAQSPVVFLERGRLYRSEPPKDSQGNMIAAMAEYWNVPDGYYTLPIGKARRVRIGEGPVGAVIVAWGTMVLESCTAAANVYKRTGSTVEIVDLRSLAPFDEETVAAAVREANRVLVVTEESDLTSFGRHVHSWIVEHCFYDLDGLPVFISALPVPAAPYNGIEETAFLPSARTIEEKLEALLVE